MTLLLDMHTNILSPGSVGKMSSLPPLQFFQRFFKIWPKPMKYKRFKHIHKENSYRILTLFVATINFEKFLFLIEIKTFLLFQIEWYWVNSASFSGRFRGISGRCKRGRKVPFCCRKGTYSLTYFTVYKQSHYYDSEYIYYKVHTALSLIKFLKK